MAYDYQTERPWLFTDEGQREFLKVRDRAFFLAEQAGAFMVGKAIERLSGDSWHGLACIDRLVELGEFKFVFVDTATQYKVLIRVRYEGHFW